MSRICLKIAVLMLFVLTACDTYVSTKTIGREILTFRHAGEKIAVPVELQEIRTSKRRGRLFSGRDVSYTFAMVVFSGTHELFQYPCEESASIDDFIGKLKIRRSKDRKHFAIGIEDETIAIFHVFNKHYFAGYSPLFNPEEGKISFKTLALNDIDSPRDVLLAHISEDKVLRGLDENTLVDILCSVSPQDELNQEAIYMLTENKLVVLDKNNETRLINHCRKSENWRKRALFLLKENKENQDSGSYIAKVYALAGKEAVEEEDRKALRNFERDNDITYFKLRLEMLQPKLDNEVKKQFKAKLERSVYNICGVSDSKRKDILQSIRLLEDLGERDVFMHFMEKYESSGCKPATIHEINNVFMFISDLKPSEKRVWIDFMLRNFQFVPKNDRSWDYDRIREELSCSQKRDLLLRYKKDIDTFDDMEIPVCN